MNRPPNRIIHLHIPKTAGTALRGAFERTFADQLRIFPYRDEREFEGFDPEEFDFFSGHFGFATASRIGGDIITVFRNPVDRFISVYYFWRQLYATGIEQSWNTLLATRYSLDEFVRLKDEPFVMEEFFNRMTWQVAHGGSLSHRHQLRQQAKTEDDVYRTAVNNITSFAVVGIQERLGEFTTKLREKYMVEIELTHENITENKVRKSDLPIETLRRIHDWVYMDLELYQHVLHMTSRAVVSS